MEKLRPTWHYSSGYRVPIIIMALMVAGTGGLNHISLSSRSWKQQAKHGTVTGTSTEHCHVMQMVMFLSSARFSSCCVVMCRGGCGQLYQAVSSCPAPCVVTLLCRPRPSSQQSSSSLASPSCALTHNPVTFCREWELCLWSHCFQDFGCFLDLAASSEYCALWLVVVILLLLLDCLTLHSQYREGLFVIALKRRPTKELFIVHQQNNGANFLPAIANIFAWSASTIINPPTCSHPFP